MYQLALVHTVSVLHSNVLHTDMYRQIRRPVLHFFEGSTDPSLFDLLGIQVEAVAAWLADALRYSRPTRNYSLPVHRLAVFGMRALMRGEGYCFFDRGESSVHRK